MILYLIDLVLLRCLSQLRTDSLEVTWKQILVCCLWALARPTAAIVVYVKSGISGYPRLYHPDLSLSGLYGWNSADSTLSSCAEALPELVTPIMYLYVKFPRV